MEIEWKNQNMIENRYGQAGRYRKAAAAATTTSNQNE